MKRSGLIVASILASVGCAEKKAVENLHHTSVLGTISPERIAGWWRACSKPLTFFRGEGHLDAWAVECQEDLGGEPKITVVPPVNGEGAKQRGWRVEANGDFQIARVGVVGSPEHFASDAAHVVRVVMPAALHGEALRSITFPLMPGERIVSRRLRVDKHPHQSAPLMQRLDAGRVFATTGIWWMVFF